jgi:hypothetical protein
LNKEINYFKTFPYIDKILKILSTCLLDPQIDVRLEATIIIKNLTPIPDGDFKEELSNVCNKNIIYYIYINKRFYLARCFLISR